MKLLNNILDGQWSFFDWELLSFHPLCDFVAVTTQFYYHFLSKKAFKLILCDCANVSTYM